jgi:hypothetical protein
MNALTMQSSGERTPLRCNLRRLTQSPSTNQWRIRALPVTVCPFMQFGPLPLHRPVWSPAQPRSGSSSLLFWLPRRFSFLALALVALFVSAQAQTNQVSTNVPPLPFPTNVAPGVSRIALIQHYALTESSGLAASRQYPGVLWSHNDTGDPTFLFALNRRGEHLGAFEVQDANLIDWEATTFDEFNRLYFADTGTNGMLRSHSAVHRAAEPDPTSARSGAIHVERSWFIRFPGERDDCEAIFIHNNFAYLISKYAVNDSVRMYRFDLANESSSILLELVGHIPVTDNVSDATLSVDKSRLVLLSSDGVFVLFIYGDPNTAPIAPRRVIRYENSLMEGSAIVEDGILATTETTQEILLFSSPGISGAPRIITGLTNRSAFVGGSVTFQVEVEGFPAPVIQWRFNGQVIPGATNTTLTLTNLDLTNAGMYEVSATNPAGAARSRAQLTVSERIRDLRITEVMSSEATPATEDWWELTSFDSQTNDLSGWRFNDSTGNLTDAFVIPEGTVIGPGESIIFVEDLAPDEFRVWWGTNVPAGVQIVTYSTNFISFNAVRDQLRVWDNITIDPSATALQVDFGASTTGVSFTLDPASSNLVNSVLGVNGAFQSASGLDIGSPGLYVTNSATNSGVRLEGTLMGPALELSFPTAPTETYSIEQSDTLIPGNWRTVIQGVQGPAAGRILFQRSLELTNRFFRLRVEER